jgi:N-acetylglucosamine kinase-like BadF-type ATPase
MKQHDGRGEPTELTELILSHWSLTDPDRIIPYVYGQSNVRAAIAEISKLTIAAAKSGDAVAQAIVQESITELAEMVITVRTRLFERQPEAERGLRLVLSGGVFTDDWFMSLLCEQHDIRTSGFTISRLLIPPVAGCYILALKQAGIIISDSVKTRIGAWESRREA